MRKIKIQRKETLILGSDIVKVGSSDEKVKSIQNNFS